MNPYYAEYIATAKLLASERGLAWDLICDEHGKVSQETRWNLTAMAGLMPPPTIYLGQLGVDALSFEKLNLIRASMGQSIIPSQAMTHDWRDLYQAVLIEQLLIRRNKPKHAFDTALVIRQLAAAVGDAPPWKVTPEQVQQAYNAVLQSSVSGKAAMNFEMVMRLVFVGKKLVDLPLLARFCSPYPTSDSQTAQTVADSVRTRQNAHGGRKGLRRELAERKSASKLPDERAFWELVRIVFTETPMSFSDVIRFAALKAQIIMGFRVGEAALLPVDWKRWKDYLDADGTPAGLRGGFSRSLMIRHFAEKQEEDERAGGQSFYENTQHVPTMYEEVLVETLDYVEKITAPLRERLRLQTETGRVFPEYPEDALVSASEMYVRMTGNAIFTKTDLPASVASRYRETYDPQILDEIRTSQFDEAPNLAWFWNSKEYRDIQIRTASGVPMNRVNWRSAFVRVGDLERFVKEKRATKLSDVAPTTTTDGVQLFPHQLLFIMPIRNLIENRNGGILDATLYSSIGRLSVGDLIQSLSGAKVGPSLFETYGQTDEDRAVRMTSHSLRHLQNTELFRLGVADTIITKKFNRRSVQQSYVYDHRSLAEDLADIDVPPEAEAVLGDKALQVFKLITANKAVGPIVTEFRKVQREYGDAAAFDYLNAEADGLHVTPYGLCMNSFTSDPCPKHLECFNGCMHLARTKVVSEAVHLERMRDKFAKVIITLEGLPESRRNVGWANQLTSARIKYDNIVKTLAAQPGEQVFPGGKDLSVTPEQKFGNTIIDTMKHLRDLDD